MTSPTEQGILDKIEELKAQIRHLETTLAILRGDETAGSEPVRRRAPRQPRTDRIIDVLADSPDGMTRAELAEALNMRGDEHLLSAALAHLKRTNRVDRREGDRRWFMPA